MVISPSLPVCARAGIYFEKEHAQFIKFHIIYPTIGIYYASVDNN